MAESHSAHGPATGEIGALRELKRAEAKVRELKDAAREDADATLKQATADAREARRSAEEMARASYEAHLEKARKDAKVRAEGITAQGRDEAEAIRAAATGATFESAVENVLSEFRSRTGA